jgi:molybdopterin converting factor small subunit
MGDDRIEVTVLWFASLRERRGAASERVTTVDGISVGNLLRELLGPEPGATVAFVVNRSRVPASTALTGGDEVAFLPPLGGG